MDSSLEIIRHSGSSDPSWLGDLIAYPRNSPRSADGGFSFEWVPRREPLPDNYISFYALHGTGWLSVMPDQIRSVELGNITVKVGETDHTLRVIIKSSTVKAMIEDALSYFNDPDLGVGVNTNKELERYILIGLLGDEDLLAEAEECNRQIIRSLAVGVLSKLRNYELVEVTGWLAELFTFPAAQRSTNSPRNVPASMPEPPEGSPLEDFFEWVDSCEAVGRRITLKYVATRVHLSYGNVRKKHGKYKKLDEPIVSARRATKKNLLEY